MKANQTSNKTWPLIIGCTVLIFALALMVRPATPTHINPQPQLQLSQLEIDCYADHAKAANAASQVAQPSAARVVCSKTGTKPTANPDGVYAPAAAGSFKLI